jgi:hypothetical protein
VAPGLSNISNGNDRLPSYVNCRDNLKDSLVAVISVFHMGWILNVALEVTCFYCCFCSGSDLLVVRQITVNFVSIASEFARVPVAHTCGCVLDLPTTYANFMEFRKEFCSILESGVWIMDIV